MGPVCGAGLSWVLGRLEAVTLFLSQLEDKSFKVMRSLLLKWRESRVSASPATRGRSRPRQEACPPILPAPHPPRPPHPDGPDHPEVGGLGWPGAGQAGRPVSRQGPGYFPGRVGEGRACWSLGNAYVSMGSPAQALTFAKKHLEISQEVSRPCPAPAPAPIPGLSQRCPLPYHRWGCQPTPGWPGASVCSGLSPAGRPLPPSLAVATCCPGPDPHCLLW